MSYIEIAILVIILWIIGMILARPYIKSSKHFQTLGGIILLVKVTKNRRILDRISSLSQSKLFSRFSIVLVYFLLISGLALLIYGTALSFTVRAVVPLNEYLALPGINPDIPITYGLVAFAFSIVIHEMFHGIVARKHGIKVNSVGVMFFIVPIGAFVEPDEKEITDADPVVRRRIVAAGIAVNLVIAVFAFLITSLVLSHAAVQAMPGSYIDEIVGNSTMKNLNISGQELISFGNVTGNAVNNLTISSYLEPGMEYKMTVYNGKEFHDYMAPAGVEIDSLINGYPAQKAGVNAGSFIISIDNKTAYNELIINDVLNAIKPGTNISMVTESFNYSNGHFTGVTNVYHFKTVSTYSFYRTYYPSLANSTQKNESFIGVTTTYAGLGLIPISYLKSIVFGSTAFTGGFTGIIQTIALPLEGLSPIPASFTALFTVPLGGAIFWPIVNMAYWFYWVNILLAITNALPLAIFDGAQFFRDTLIIAGRHRRLSYFSKEENIAKVLSLVSFMVFFMLMLEIIVPRII
ncbi:site-2 protease family protein [Cuniculiplasma sp. SKW3]|uniref:site-2 protease family protein n=1 Tax=Cuniculiplasma sp. SKW3 TaxID=3400170 RepID=UPI003FD088D4